MTIDNKVLVTVSNGKEEKQFWTCFNPDDRDYDGSRYSIKERMEDLEFDLNDDIKDGVANSEIEFTLDAGYTVKVIKRIKQVPNGVPAYPMY